MTDSGIDWPHWLTRSEITLWQAVALTLQIDPALVHRSRDGSFNDPGAGFAFDGPPPRAHVVEEFGKRLRLLIASRAERRHFTPATTVAGLATENTVALAELVRWLIAMERAPIPDELLTLLDTTAPRPSPPQHWSPAQTPPDATGQQRQLAWQEAQILRTTRALGYDPLALPKDDPTRNFVVKSIIRERCGRNDAVKMRANLFNKAWDRLLRSEPRALKYAD